MVVNKLCTQVGLERWGATLPTGFALNRSRLQLTGLEEPEELWDRLKEALAESQRLAAANKKLSARVQVLERQVSEVGGLTDDELVAELPNRMGRALESAQGVARDIVRRARKNEAAIRQNAVESAAEIVREAEGQASAYMERAVAEATAHVAKAEESASEIIGSARRRRKEILSELQNEALTLQEQIKVLRRDQTRVLHAYDVVERTLVEARRALHQADAAPQANAPPPRQRPQASAGVAGPRNGHKPVPLPTAVYDWFPPATSTG